MVNYIIVIQSRDQMLLDCKIKHVDKEYLIIWNNIHSTFGGKGILKTQK